MHTEYERERERERECLHGGALAALEGDEERRHWMRRESLLCAEAVWNDARCEGNLGILFWRLIF